MVILQPDHPMVVGRITKTHFKTAWRSLYESDILHEPPFMTLGLPDIFV